MPERTPSPRFPWLVVLAVIALLLVAVWANMGLPQGWNSRVQGSMSARPAAPPPKNQKCHQLP